MKSGPGPDPGPGVVQNLEAAHLCDPTENNNFQERHDGGFEAALSFTSTRGASVCSPAAGAPSSSYRGSLTGLTLLNNPGPASAASHCPLQVRRTVFRSSPRVKLVLQPHHHILQPKFQRQRRIPARVREWKEA